MALPAAEAFMEIAEIITAEDVEAAATTALLDGDGEEIITGGSRLLTGTTNEGKVVIEPIFEELRTNLGAVELLGPSDLGNLSKGQLQALWQNTKAFACWTGREIMKGALFETGLQAVEALIAKHLSSGPQDTDVAKIIGSIAAALKITNQVLTEWRRWCVQKFSDRDNFGIVDIEDTLVSRFEIFRNKLGNISLYMQKSLGPILAQLSRNIDEANIGALKAAMTKYADMTLALSKDIKEKEHLMVQAGLKYHPEELQKARDLLN